MIVEAEDAVTGAEMSSASEGGVEFLTATSDGAGNSPGSEARTARFSVTFPEAGIYQLYVRLYVGPESGSDDSFFYGNGFGEKDPADDADWILVNQLGSGIGSTSPEDYVPGEGAAGSQVWKWVMLSGFNGGEDPINFSVPSGQLTQTFDIGAREDGLRIDKFAFGWDGFFYTVDNLDKGEAGAESTPNEPFTPTGPPIATGKWKWLGSVHSASQLQDFTAYWNQVTPENAGKWGSVEGTRDVMNWGGLDAAYDFAKENGYKFRMHILIWGAQQPGWINDLSPEEQLVEIEEWISAVAERYPDIDYLEVVNEPLHQAPDGGDTGVVSGRANYIAALGGEGETGWDWLIESFRLARKYFPDTPLVINDYGIIGSAQAVDDYLEIVDLLMAEDLIDVISFQAHAFSTRTSAAVMEQNLDTLASRGLPIMVTEMDVDGATDLAQLSDYKKIFPVFWEHPAVIGVTLWGFRPGMWRSDQGAYLVLNNGAERPAMKWLRDYVAESDFPGFEGYVEERGLSLELHGFEVDVDGDGMTTGLEYLIASDPATPDRHLLEWKMEDDLDTLRTKISSLARDGRVELQSSSDLENWTTEALFDLLLQRGSGFEIDLEEESVTLEMSASIGGDSEKRFYRISFKQ
ncbi:Glycosyl hydrolase family 10 protein [Verrucomicrobiia bacterium DG1235]|nr:Glycosyl hydrolase family 10 protein [Verrucomicrobiae bacterium DG1235]